MQQPPTMSYQMTKQNMVAIQSMLATYIILFLNSSPSQNKPVLQIQPCPQITNQLNFHLWGLLTCYLAQPLFMKKIYASLHDTKSYNPTTDYKICVYMYIFIYVCMYICVLIGHLQCNIETGYRSLTKR